MSPWEDTGLPVARRADALVQAVEGRKDLKRLAAWFDAHADDALRRALVARAAAHGIELPGDAVSWPGKKLLRRASGREVEAQRRTTPIARDEAFACMHCGRAVPPHGRTARDHCPWCLRSRHVDVVPGDRAADCGGRMDPFEVTVTGRAVVIRYACTRCRAEKQVRAVLDGEVPDDWDVLCKLSSGVLG